MITTVFLLQLISFELLYLSSKQNRQQKLPVYLAGILLNAKGNSIASGALLFISAALFISQLGWASGLSSAVFGAMAAGSLIVVLQPFNYLRIPAVALIYVFALLLEIFI